MALYVGTSGWAYREWKPLFYPEGLPQGRFLAHYSTLLTACEINATFYRSQSEEAVKKWAQATPERFRFVTKAHRRLTHSKNPILDALGRAQLAEFLQSLAALGPRLGGVLYQLPAHRKRDDGFLDAFLRGPSSAGRFAIDFVDDSWVSPDVAERVAEAGGTVCYSDRIGDPPAALPPGPIGYVRLRAGRYADSARSQWLDLFRHEATGRDVYAFVKHEGVAPDDPYGGVGLARWMTNCLA
ncbi:MAG: DUF72 domain-containing protein [Actinomycetota bacterium]